MSTSSTSIAWTDRTWNPVRGCSRVSEGCRHCYAESVAARFSRPGLPFHDFATQRPARWTGKVDLVESALLAPLSWRKPARVFVNSMSDLFHEALPDEAIDRVFATMALAPRHTFQILTKRPERMREYLKQGAASGWYGRINDAARDAARAMRWKDADGLAVLPTQQHGMVPGRMPPPNVWLGVSAENQATADERIPLLLQTPAAARFVSCEPLLGPVDLKIDRWVILPRSVESEAPMWFPGARVDAGIYEAKSNPLGAISVPCPSGRLGIKPDEFEWAPRLDWVIVGGESGPGARPMDPAWAGSLARQCEVAGVPMFFKQWGTVTAKALGLKDRKGADPAEWPADLRVQEFPG